MYTCTVCMYNVMCVNLFYINTQRGCPSNPAIDQNLFYNPVHILACLRWKYRRSHGNAGGRGGARNANGGGAGPVEKTAKGGHSNVEVLYILCVAVCMQCTEIVQVLPIPGPPQMQSTGSGQQSKAVLESDSQSPSAMVCFHDREATTGGSSTSRGINTGTADHSPHHWCACACTLIKHFGD